MRSLPHWVHSLTTYLFNIGVVAVAVAVFSWPMSVPVLAESIQIFATVAANPSHFQIELLPPPSTSVRQGTTTTYTLRYGSYLPTATDTIVLKVTWRVEDGPGMPIDLVEYVSGSATPAIGGAMPQVDIPNRTITWQISPMPSGADKLVSWSLRTTSTYTSPNPVNYSVNAELVGPGVHKQANPLIMTYLFDPMTDTPSPIPTLGPIEEPNFTPSYSPPNLLQPVIDRLIEVPVIGPIVERGSNIIEKISRRGGAVPATTISFIVLLIPAIARIISLMGLIPWWQLPSLLGALFWAKRRQPWGVVYDAKTKLPLDPVVLTLTDEKGRVYTTVSDIYGRYQFLVEAGKYLLEVKKSNYTYPATSLNHQSSDGLYDDLFYDKEIMVDDATAINFNIPMDPVKVDWNQQKKSAMGLHKSGILIDKGSQWLFWAGFGWSLVMTLFAATSLNLGIMLFYLLLIGLRLLVRWRSPWGVIFDQHNRPIEAAAVSLIDINHPLVKRPPVITNRSGRYAFLVNQGQYRIEVALKNALGYGVPAPGPTVTVSDKHGTINQDLVIEELKTEPSAVI
jgi:hypothetical protein